MGAAPLPRRADERGSDRVDETRMRVGDHQSHAGEATSDETTQEREPSCAVFGGDHIDTEDLAVPIRVHAGRDHRRDVDDPATLTDLLRQRVHPHVRVGPVLERTVAELRDDRVELGSHPTHLRLRQRLDPERLHQPVHATRGHAADVTLGDHRDECLLRPSARVEQPVREVAALPQLRDRKLDRARPCVERPSPVAVALGHPIRADLPPAGTDQHVDFCSHEPLRELAHHLPDQIVVRGVELLAQPRQFVHRVRVDHRVVPLARLRKDCKRLTRWSSRQADPPPLHHYLGLNSPSRPTCDFRSCAACVAVFTP
jgi:hypothetical protein